MLFYPYFLCPNKASPKKRAAYVISDQISDLSSLCPSNGSSSSESSKASTPLLPTPVYSGKNYAFPPWSQAPRPGLLPMPSAPMPYGAPPFSTAPFPAPFPNAFFPPPPPPPTLPQLTQPPPPPPPPTLPFNSQAPNPALDSFLKVKTEYR